MIADQDPRIVLLRDLVEANNVIEVNVAGTLNANFAFLQGMAAAGGLLLCVWLLPGIAGWLLNPWWRERRDAAWMLCGVVWWLCWSPAIVGLAMIAWAAASWLQRRRNQWAMAAQ